MIYKVKKGFWSKMYPRIVNPSGRVLRSKPCHRTLEFSATFLARTPVLTINRVVVSVLCFFLVLPWVGMWCVIVAFLVHTHLLFLMFCQSSMYVLGAEKKLLSKPFYICSQNLVLKYSSLGSFALLDIAVNHLFPSF